VKQIGLLLLVVATAALASSCQVNEYCVTCAVGDAAVGDGAGRDGTTDAITDGGPPTDGGCLPVREVCDNLDNDCDNRVDENTATEPLPDIGGTCSRNVGECREGVYECVAGERKCSGVEPKPEECNNKDDDCDGAIDQGDPGGNITCGSDVGECISGLTHCISGAIDCVGDVGVPAPDPNATPEICDGKDNDCDDMFDEDLPAMGSCPGGTNVGECEAGLLMCRGGRTVCVGQVGPSFEICDNLDQDCDGNNTNGYDLQNDARNCGTCNHVCAGEIPHATATCRTAHCVIGACDPDYWDVDRNNANGCEYGPCQLQGPQEACNGMDDNCNAMTDEALTPPANFCRSLGECGAIPGVRPAVQATCTGTNGWDCIYEPDPLRDVTVDANGDIIPENKCDAKDNDCDGRVDEGHATLGQPCDDGRQGICRGTGVFVCDAANPTGPAICMITSPGQPQGTESCNGLDDDCDGMVDDGAQTGNLPGQNWVTIGGVQIMKFEASRPDASGTAQGNRTSLPCSKSGVLPWTNVKQPEAEAACTSIGARLCTEQEWQRSCSVLAGTTYPAAQPATGAGKVFIEAENYFSRAQGTSGGVARAWVPDTTAGFSGFSALRASPNTDVTVTQANAPTQSPRLDYQINFTQTGNHSVWVLMNAPRGADNSVYVGINATLPGTAQQQVSLTNADTDSDWHWVQSADINVTATGNRFVNIYMREDGVKVDAIVVQRNTGAAPTDTSGAGNKFAYRNNPPGSDPNVYNGNTCNGNDFDTSTGTAGDQDDIIRTGQLANCFADGTGTNDAFDMSGNIREWTAERLPGANPIRGGSSNNEADGISCGLAFTLADDSFFFPNVGFRCCR